MCPGNFCFIKTFSTLDCFWSLQADEGRTKQRRSREVSATTALINNLLKKTSMQHHTHFIVIAQLLLLLPIASVSVLGSTDPMVLSHNALRTEVHSMITALDTLIGRVDETQDSVPKWTIDTLKEWWEKHVGHASDHCSSEQTVYKPLVNEKWPDIIDQTQDAMDSTQKKVTKSIAKLSAEKSSLVAVHNALITYEDMMLKNFGAEERTVLPLLHSNVSPEEMSQIQRKMLEEGHDNAMGALIYALSPDVSRSKY